MLIFSSVWGVVADPSTLSDITDPSWSNDGRTERKWQIVSLAHPVESLGECRGSRGCGACCRPQSHHKGSLVRNTRSQHKGMDRRIVHSHSKKVSLACLLRRAVILVIPWKPRGDFQRASLRSRHFGFETRLNKHKQSTQNKLSF